MELIQRVPRGLLELLSISGGQANKVLLDEVRGIVDQLQFYGLQQQRVTSLTNAALAELTNLDIVNQGVASATVASVGCQYALLFACDVTVVKTATVTALAASLAVLRNGNAGIRVISSELGPFGATETGTRTVSFVPPYPWLLIPPWTIRGRIDILGTDATASCTVGCEIGVLT